MKIIILLLSLLCSKKIIKNADLPSCRNCIYYEPKYDNDLSNLNKCNKFGVKNIISDEINYDFADSCRNDENKCGIEGKYFEEESNLTMKILKYKLLNNIPIIFVFTIIIGLAEITLILSKNSLDL
jgi:hypothetical protein